MSILRQRSIALLTLGALAGCVSAEKRVDQGVRLEQSGRPAEAARRYADALRRDPSLADVRIRLRESGDRAIQEMLAEAAVTTPPEAADAFLEADELRRVAGAVGVPLSVPADYDARRRSALDRAIDHVLASAADASARGDFGAAADRLGRASDRWEASPGQRAALARARFDVHLGWAEASLASGRYRQAHQRAADAITALGPGSAAAPRALDVQAEALRRGTIRIAVLPASVVSDLRGRLPGELLAELNDELTLERWRQRPLFVSVADPQAVAREARRRGYLRQVPTRTEARSLGDAMGADLAVMLVVDSVEVGESDVQQTRVAVRTQAGADTAYTLSTGRQRLRVRLAYNVVDVDGYAQPERDAVWADVSTRFRRATYRGDPATLAIPRADRELFAATEPRPGPEQLRTLATELAERLERDLYQAVERRVP